MQPSLKLILALGVLLGGGELRLASARQATPAGQAQPAPAAAPDVSAPAFDPFVYPSGVGTPLADEVRAILADSAVLASHWGIAVTDLDGRPIFGLDEGKLFRPASNAKLFTAAAALSLLGPGATVATTLTSVGPIDSAGTLHGDLVLHGAGDANLSGRHLPYESAAAREARQAADKAASGSTDFPDPEAALPALDDLVAQLAAKGVKRIAGSVVADDTLWPVQPYGDTWELGDLPWEFAAPVSALAVRDNAVRLRVAPGEHVGDRASASLSPSVPGEGLQCTAVTVAAGSPAELELRLDGSGLQVAGTISLGKPGSESVAALHPAAFAAAELQSRLEARSIAVTEAPRVEERAVAVEATTPKPLSVAMLEASMMKPEAAPCDGCTVLASHLSPPLAEDVVVTLKVSQNLHAEMMLRRLGRAYGEDGTFTEGTRVVRAFLLGVGLRGDDFRLFDGSGLSSHDLLTPRAAAQLLAWAMAQHWSPAWVAALPVSGVDGTLETRFTGSPLKGHLAAKTGTLGESRSLSGYLDAASGKKVIVSIFADGHLPGSSADRDAMERIIAAIAVNE